MGHIIFLTILFTIALFLPVYIITKNKQKLTN